MQYMDDFDQCVSDFMDDFGGLGVLTIVGQGEYNPDTGDYTAAETDYNVQTILLDLALKADGLSYNKDTLIQLDDKRAYVRPINKADATLTMPKVQPNRDRFAIGGITYKIVTLKTHNPSVTNNVLFEFILRE